MRRLIVGILAHVDAGKTTLSESLLFNTGVLKKLGRVDSGDAYLDTDAMEKSRGITIFSKEAQMKVSGYTDEELVITLVDTPGHVDFSAEMERALNILDVAILVISGIDGVQPHTKTLWRLLRRYNIPTIIFINKLDMGAANFAEVIADINEKLDSECFDFSNFVEGKEPSFEDYENIATCSEEMLSEFLETEQIEYAKIVEAIRKRMLFPVVGGSALKNEGVTQVLELMAKYVIANDYNTSFGAYVYKITRDEKGVRLTHLKITGGTLRVKELLGPEKVNDIRIYSGDKYDSVTEAEAGMVVAVPGLAETKPGMSFGASKKIAKPFLEPVLSYAVRYPADIDRTLMLRYLTELEEELPELKVEYDEDHREIRVSLMGAVQTEILTQLMFDRYSVAISFDVGSIAYKETIASTVEGVGHFEPLRHYAEVHLLMEPGENGSGLRFESKVSEDLLDKNWQRLIMTHLGERVHRGVLTGSPITDMKITIVGGRAHTKHTEGGDFRQATYRAIRQGLMMASSRLLEPYYDYTLEIPEEFVGKAMTDIDRMHGSCVITENVDGIAVLNGRAPVATMHTYASDVVAYSKGEGRINLASGGYDYCHNEEEVLMNSRYNPDADKRNPSASVFCSHGAGVIVNWDEVYDYMHVPLTIGESRTESEGLKPLSAPKHSTSEMTISLEEIDEIINRTANSNKKSTPVAHKGISAARARSNRETTYIPPKVVEYKGTTPRKKYLLVDGYNVIFAWEDLNDLARTNIDSARDKLLDVMCNYQAIIGEEIIVVFDAYKLHNHPIEYLDFHNIHVVYTRTAQTADAYIEHFAHEHGKKYDISVATSDGLEQIITRGEGCRIISSRELKQYVSDATVEFNELHSVK